ncbi:hypothetical protein THAOC_01883, partial [Thalassiosira oceanica]
LPRSTASAWRGVTSSASAPAEVRARVPAGSPEEAWRGRASSASTSARRESVEWEGLTEEPRGGHGSVTEPVAVGRGDLARLDAGTRRAARGRRDFGPKKLALPTTSSKIFCRMDGIGDYPLADSAVADDGEGIRRALTVQWQKKENGVVLDLDGNADAAVAVRLRKGVGPLF